MKKYWLIIKNTWTEYFIYRLNFILWRVRMVMRFLITFFLWSSVYGDRQNYFGYTQSQMLTYVILMYVVSNIVFATRTHDIGSEIHEGRLTNILLRPISYFEYLISRDVSDKALNFFCTVIETILLVILFRPEISFTTSPVLWAIGIATLVGSIAVYFLVSVLLGFIGFWSPEIWAPRFIFFMVMEFLSGTYFPIDILPKAISQILLLTPFPYFFYFPVKIFLGEIPQSLLFSGLIIQSFWLVVLTLSVSIVWRRGLKTFSAEGR